MRHYLIPALIVAAAVAAPAQAAVAPTIIFTNGQYGVPAYITNPVNLQTFEGFANGQTPPGASFLGNVKVRTGSVPGQYLDVDNNPNNKYLAIGSGTYTVAFAAAQVFSFSLGSLDRYNSLTLKFSDNTSRSYTGAGIVGLSDPGGSSNFFPIIGGRVTFDMRGGAGIVGAVFGSTQAAFEIDDLVTAAPEPATWGMMILGFGLAGAQLRSRRRSAKLAVA